MLSGWPAPQRHVLDGQQRGGAEADACRGSDAGEPRLLGPSDPLGDTRQSRPA